MALLTPAANNTKTAKLADELQIEAAILHLAPSTLSGHNTCPMASKGCAMACLNTAGRGTMQSVQDARIRKTQQFYSNRAWFMTSLALEIQALERKASRAGRTAAVRLNGTSDIRWEIQPVLIDGTTYANLMDAFPAVMFYDYTKIPNRRNLPINYHLTFSLSENNDRHAIAQLENGVNVAVVLDYGDELPETWSGYRVIDGDKHDYRFLDGSGPYIVALKAKGGAKKDTSGFVRTLETTLDTNRVPVVATQTRITLTPVNA